MAGWLAQLTQRRGTPAEAERQPFRITCECGQEHAGERRRRHQQIVCNDCGTALYVLPASTYPPPPERRKRREKPTAKRAAEKRAAAATERTDSLGDSMLELPALASDRMGAAWRRLRETIANRATAAGRWIRSQATPLKLTVAALLLVMIGSAGWTVRQAQRATARQDYEVGSEAGFALVADGEIRAAAEALGKAAAAADRLGYDDDTATGIRVAARELTALADLSSDSIPDVVGKLADDPFEDGVWSKISLLRFGERWHVWEGPITGATITLPMPIDGTTVVIDIGPLAGTIDGERTDGQTDRPVILAGRIAEITRDGDTLTVRLGDDAFLWQSLTTYRKLGIPFDAGHEEAVVSRILQTQAEWTGQRVDPFGDFPSEDEPTSEDETGGDS